MREHTHSPASGGARQLWKEARTFADILRRRAAEQGQVPAFTFLGAEASEELTLTYGELDLRARAIAMELETRGLSGQRVLIALPPGPASVASLFGCLYAGVIAVPVPPPLYESPGLEPKLLAAIAQDSGAAAALVGGERPAEGQRLTLDGLAAHIELIPTEGLTPARSPADWTPPFVDPRAIALLQYTAGTTGPPKGVRVTHASLLDNVEALRRGLGQTPTDKLLLWLPTHQGLGLLQGVLQPLFTGLPAVLLPPRVFFQRPQRWLEAISTHGATLSGAPDFAYELCVRRVSEAERAALDLSRWRVAFSSGETVRAETMERFSSHFAPCGFQPKAFRPVYGLAESTYVVSCGRSEDGPTLRGVGLDALAQQRITERRGAATKLVSCGPAASVQVIIVNPATRALRGDQEIGEVWVTGLSVTDGYWGRVATTSEAFRGRLAGSAAGMRAFMRTGDFGATSGGELYVTGRLQDVIIWEGHDLRLHDLEFDVESSHPALVPGSCAAFAHKNGRQEQLILVAEAFLPGTSPTSPGGAQALLREITRAVRLNMYQRHGLQPAELLLVREGSLPRSSLGRVSRNAVRTASPSSFAAQVLLRDRGEEPTEMVATLQAPASEAGAASRGEPAQQGPTPPGLAPLTPAMHAVHAPARALEHPTGACRVFELPEGTRWQHMEEALHAVWMAHETLRLRFARSEAGGPQSWAASITPEKSPVPLTRIELSSRPDEECWQLVERMARDLGAEIAQCTGSLVSFVFCDRGPHSPAWLLAACHPALLDESSWRILSTDLAEACEQSRTRGRVRLTPQSGSLTKWVQELMSEIQLPRIASEARAHWLIRSTVPATARATPAPREAPAPGALAVIDVEALRRASTLFEVSQEALLLAACALAYGTQLQRSSMRISLEQSARVSSHYPVDASRMLGNLDFAFPALLSLEPETAPQEVLRSAQAELLQAPLGGLAYDGLRAYGEDRSLAQALTALPAPDFTLHLAEEGAPSSRETLRTLAIFESGSSPGTSAARLRVEARLSAERAQLLWHGVSSDGALLSALAKQTELTIRALCAQAENVRGPAAQAPGAPLAPTAQRSR